ncbi:hypothetical protein [Sphingomonas astaxanthinifaciens]|uniref:hypothetical protein n=1 Tax=Sphingomonas astaxanthinifaciens TaxID=407019 RepID=UPI000A45E1A0|nr:hypothetical protein [Sphingomonas astaxanthinifaciens]
MSLFQSAALVGIFLVAFSSLAVAYQGETSRRELERCNALLKDLLATMRERL